MPTIKAAGGGSIINLLSTAGRLGFPLRTPYAAAKWAVVGLTKSLAVEAGPDKVRVNCLQPGIVEGELERIITDKARATGAGKHITARRSRSAATCAITRIDSFGTGSRSAWRPA